MFVEIKKFVSNQIPELIVKRNHRVDELHSEEVNSEKTLSVQKEKRKLKVYIITVSLCSPENI